MSAIQAILKKTYTAALGLFCFVLKITAILAFLYVPNLGINVHKNLGSFKIDIFF
jgi:hypothetical protein